MSDKDAGEPRPVGRPTLYKPEYCDRVIELGRLGKSKAQIASELNVSRMTLENWASANPDFLDALNAAKDFALAWWENTAQSGMTTGAFAQGGAAIWSRSMAARFPADYREEHRTEITGKDGERLISPGQTTAAAVAAAAAIACAKDPVEAAKRYQDLMAGD